MRRTLIESLTFSAVCCGLALANALLNPSALSLFTNYAPTASSAEIEHEFKSIDSAELASYLDILFDEQPYVMLLDARSKADYEIAHIPGAHLADHYQQQQYLQPLTAALQQAPIVVVYCKGGDCEDSIFLARDLVYRYGLATESLRIYEGGMNDWLEQQQPTTTGDKR
ncbi:MAG: rhodanese-related sulfurtransferase [Myxococcota bacterium]|jgi:rhodanese-related sulfurtransferase